MFQLCPMVFAQECECLHLCVPCLIHISPKVLTSTRDENVNQALKYFSVSILAISAVILAFDFSIDSVTRCIHYHETILY